MLKNYVYTNKKLAKIYLDIFDRQRRSRRSKLN